MFYQLGGVMKRYRIFSINSPPNFVPRPSPASPIFQGKSSGDAIAPPSPPTPAWPGVYYKRCLVSLNLQSALARFLLRRVDSFFLAGVNLAPILLIIITQMNE